MARRRAPGEGTIIPWNGKWKAVLSLGTVGGKRIRKTRTARTRADAAELLRRMKEEAGQQRSLVSDRISTGDLLSRYLDDFVALQRSPATHALYRSAIETHLQPSLKKVPLNSLSPLTINGLLADMSRAGVGTRSAQNSFDVLNRALKWAITMGYLAAHPMQGLSRPGHESEEIKPFTQAEALRLIEESAGETTHALLILALTTGMRQGELFGLEWPKVDFAKSRLRVDQAAAEVEGAVSLRKPKTRKSVRTVNLTPDAVGALREHKALQLRLGLAACEMVFPAPEGGMQGRTNFNRRIWRPLLKRCGIEYRGAHHLRHTYATLALGAGVPVHVVSQVMGHSKPSITLDIYAHVLQADQQQATNAMAKLFG